VGLLSSRLRWSDISNVNDLVGQVNGAALIFILMSASVD